MGSQVTTNIILNILLYRDEKYFSISDCENNNGVLSSTYTPQSLNEVAHLCRYLGIAFGAKYNSDGSTSVGEDKPIDWFNKWGV